VRLLRAVGIPTPGADLLGGPPPGRQAAVRVQELSKTFPVSTGRRRARLAALGGVDLEVAEGEAVAIVGESGSGKTTLLRIIASLERAEAGQVTLGPGARPQMVFQDAGASLTPWLSVAILIAGRLRGAGLSAAVRRQRVADALGHVRSMRGPTAPPESSTSPANRPPTVRSSTTSSRPTTARSRCRDRSLFGEKELVDLDDELRAAFRRRAIPSPVHVTSDPQQLSDERRNDVPVTVIACEFQTAMLRAWMEQGHPGAPQLAKIRNVDHIDLPTSHWPQFTWPEDLGQAIRASVGPA
jgi:ABC-type glutathione transport system ATPase component